MYSHDPYNDDGASDITKTGALILGLLIFSVVALRISLAFEPPTKYDPKFTSRSLTGWTNTPGKLTWSRTLDKISEPINKSKVRTS